jgi:DNA-binding SARP family transcriptional activator
MGQLALTLLGGFEARTRLGEAQALLAYLALTAGLAHPRDKLTALLWPDTARGAARTALRQTLFLLRRALGPAEPDVLVTTGGSCVVRPEARAPLTPLLPRRHRPWEAGAR